MNKICCLVAEHTMEKTEKKERSRRYHKTIASLFEN